MKQIFINIIEFFVVLSIMFLVFSFFVHIIMKKVSLDGVFQSLQNKGKFIRNFTSSVIGALTPFCVCTTIPVFTGMIQMGARTDVAMSFLLASPLLNISAAVLIYFLFGLKFALYFILAVLVFSTLGGVLVSDLKLDNEIEEKISTKTCSSGDDGEAASACKDAAIFSTTLFKNLLLPLVVGAIIAGFIHNYIPVKLIESFNSVPLWLTIPLMALIGFPIYSNILLLAPVCFSLASKGLNSGAVITFMMSGAGISLPTAIVLGGIFKRKLFVYYLVYTFISYCLIGFVFNMLR